jgi:hypothetical protein
VYTEFTLVATKDSCAVFARLKRTQEKAQWLLMLLSRQHTLDTGCVRSRGICLLRWVPSISMHKKKYVLPVGPGDH